MPSAEELRASQVNCTRGHFEVDRIGCFCYPNWGGEECQKSLPYVNIFGVLGSIVGILGMLVTMYWLVLRLYFQVKKNAFGFNLNFISLGLNFIGCFARLIWCLIPSNGFLLSFDVPESVDFASSLLSAIPVTLWLCAHCLIIGFWLDLLKGKLAGRTARRTRIVVLALAGISLVRIPGLILAKVEGLEILGSVLTVAPLMVNVVGIAIVTVVIALHSNANFTTNTKRRKQRMTRRMWFAFAGWYTYLILFMYFAYSTVIDFPIRTLTIIWFLQRISEIIVTLSLAAMVDQRIGPIKLTRWLFLSSSVGDGANLTPTSSLKTGTGTATGVSSSRKKKSSGSPATTRTNLSSTNTSTTNGLSNEREQEEALREREREREGERAITGPSPHNTDGAADGSFAIVVESQGGDGESDIAPGGSSVSIRVSANESVSVNLSVRESESGSDSGESDGGSISSESTSSSFQ